MDYENTLKEAQELGATMSASPSQGSRAHNISLQHLETAQFWARQDREEKDGLAAMKGESSGGS